jgi:hypothetical protein
VRRGAAATLLAPLAALALACTATAVRRYDEPLPYAHYAAQEACATAGFQLTRVEPYEIQGERPARLGLLLGQGNEHVRVRLEQAGPQTAVEITTRKRFLFFFGARHQHERIARELDAFVADDHDLRARILEASP